MNRLTVAEFHALPIGTEVARVYAHSFSGEMQYYRARYVCIGRYYDPLPACSTLRTGGIWIGAYTDTSPPRDIWDGFYATDFHGFDNPSALVAYAPVPDDQRLIRLSA